MNVPGTIRQFRHFIALAETGSFTRAAERCHLSQPAFSRSVAMLESELNVALVDRFGKRCELTAVGRSVLDHARHVVREAEDLNHAVSVHSDGLTGSFRLGMGATPAALLTTAVLTYVANECPGLHMAISRGDLTEQVAGLRERRLDAIVVDLRAVSLSPDLHVDPMAELRTSVMCRRDHPLTRLPFIPAFEDLLAYPVASTALSEEIVRALVCAYGPNAHPERLISLRSDDVQSLLEAAIHSDAIVLCVAAAASAYIERGELVDLGLSAPDMEARYALMRLAGRTVTPFYERLRTLVREKLRAFSPPG